MILVRAQGLLQQLEEIFRVDGTVVLRGASQLFAIWILAWLALRLVRLTARRIELSVDDHDDVVSSREKRGKTISQLLRSAGRIVVLAIAILLSLNVFINIGPLLGGAAVIGLAISFGAQSLVKDVIAGFFMLVEDQFALGDVIEAGGRSGVVEKITLRVVVLRDLDGSVHTVPNGEIKTVSNRTRGWSRAVVDVAVAYAEDVNRAIAVVRDEAEKLLQDEEWSSLLDGVPEVWGVESLTDTAVNLRVVAKTQPGSHWGVARELRRRVKNRLDAEGIRSPTPKSQVKLQVDAPATVEPVPSGRSGSAT
ncbi:MAG: mechanosensitive ion channel domain-containing protein [Gemmatimonadota bacterium]